MGAGNLPCFIARRSKPSTREASRFCSVATGSLYPRELIEAIQNPLIGCGELLPLHVTTTWGAASAAIKLRGIALRCDLASPFPFAHGTTHYLEFRVRNEASALCAEWAGAGGDSDGTQLVAVMSDRMNALLSQMGLAFVKTKFAIVPHLPIDLLLTLPWSDFRLGMIIRGGSAFARRSSGETLEAEIKRLIQQSTQEHLAALFIVLIPPADLPSCMLQARRILGALERIRPDNVTVVMHQGEVGKPFYE